MCCDVTSLTDCIWALAGPAWLEPGLLPRLRGPDHQARHLLQLCRGLRAATGNSLPVLEPSLHVPSPAWSGQPAPRRLQHCSTCHTLEALRNHQGWKRPSTSPSAAVGPAPPPAPAMGSILSLPLPAAPQTAGKATQTEWNCPVCHSVQSDTDAVPCGHRFCLGCLLRHTATSPTCPLCASPLLSARFSVLGQNDFLQCILSPPGVPPGPAGWARRALFRLVHTRPGPSAPAEAACAGPEAAGGFPADEWEELLHGQEQLLEPVRPWLRQSLDAIYGPQWWEARPVESIALSTLCICGPDREALTHMLRSYLGEYTAPLVHGLIHVTMHRCRNAWTPRRSPAARQEQEESPVASAGLSAPPGGTRGPSPSLAPGPAGPGGGDPPSAPEPARPRGPGRSPAAPAPAEQPQPQPRAVPQEAAPAPGPSEPRPRRSLRLRLRPTRRSQRRRAYRYRRPLRFRKRKPKTR
ncbi:uncharacterized protein LOC125320299 [Corvus hawaiiensis]|uniref:uncharacterized protein LOC125320299 n=1 Tax=Corvus hawaiiensis TaxID=134902 RepID=UPI002018EF55|nr:uncharacterized protein LOC125320299 [Corvus hawaiiensis]